MFRFFKRSNLLSTRRRSASCPNLDRVSIEDQIEENNAQNNNASISSSESGEDDCINKFERLKAQQSVRRFHQKEKEKKEKTEKNLISMNDYLGKLSELKTWLKEERKKDVDSIRSPKLKAHFKTFVKLWNKRKLPQKYYRGCTTNLYIEDNPSSLSYSAKQHVNSPYSLIEDSAKYSTTVVPNPFGLCSEEILYDIGSPFSTFGKSGDLASPNILAEQVSAVSPSVIQMGEKSSQKLNKCHMGGSSSSGSPPKFATISRSIPATSRLYNFTTQPCTSRADVKTKPVQGPMWPNPQSYFSTPPLSRVQLVSSTLPYDIKPGEPLYKPNMEQTPDLRKSPRPSPVYSPVIDAIPYSTGSPKYAEIDEAILKPAIRPSASDYSSLSPLQECWIPYTGVKQQTVSKKQSLNRRRSKSMEDLYSVPVKTDSFVNFKHILDKEDTDVSKTPPVPERKYSPVALVSTFSDQMGKRTATFNKCCHISSSLQATSPPLSNPESGSQKRRSQEDIESVHHCTSSLKKVKSSLLSNADSDSLFSSTYENEDSSSPKLSILTGSLNPTTRSKYKSHESLKSLEPTRSTKSSDTRLSILEIKQLDESPKLSRRRLKRRSSSFSTAPGKGLIFGKAFKMSVSSPRRVSFAKNVKETDSKTMLGKSMSSRRCVTPIVTNQTQDRKEFESFLASHESPPRKSNSPNKVSSSDNSSLKTNSPPRRTSPQKCLNDVATPVSRINCESRENGHRKNLFHSRDCGDSQLGSNNLSDSNNDNRIFPSSTTRQVGRRVLGVPKASPNENIAGATQSQSPKKNLGSTSHFAFPQKSFQTACQVVSPKKNSGKIQPISSKENMEIPPQIVSSQKNMQNKTYVASSQKYIAGSSPENLGYKTHLVSSHKDLVSTSQSVAAFEGSLRTTSHNSVPTHNHMEAISPRKHFTSPQKFGSLQNNFTRQLKQHCPTKKLVDVPFSVSTSKKTIQLLVSKQAEKTTTMCAKELSSSDDCLNSDDILSVTPLSNTQRSDPKPALCTSSPGKHSQNQEMHKENGDFEMVKLDGSPGSKIKEDADYILKSEVISVKGDSGIQHTSKTSSLPAVAGELINPSLVSCPVEQDSSLRTFDNIITVQCTQKTGTLVSHPVTETCSKVYDNENANSASNELFNKTLYPISTGCEREDMRIKPINTMQCFYLPVIDLAVEYQTIPKNNCLQRKIRTANIEYWKDNADVHTSESRTKDRQTSITVMPPKVDSCTDNHPATTSLDMISKKSSAANHSAKTPLNMISKKFSSDNYPTNTSLDMKSKPFSTDDHPANTSLDMIPKKFSSDSHPTNTSLDMISKPISTDDHPANTSLDMISKKSSAANHSAKTPLNMIPKKSSLDNHPTNTSLDMISKTLSTDDHPANTSLDMISKTPSTDNHENINSASTDQNTGQCDLRRLSSIRASPKIVENDCWITERRKSSKGKSLHSFRSAYNRYLLKSSSTEENKLVMDQLSEEKILRLATDMVDVNICENVQLETNENIPDTVSQDSNKIIPIQICYTPSQIHVPPTEEKIIAVQIKPKPPTLPKPTKTSLLMNRKHQAVNNSVDSARKTATKRRSSLVRREMSTLVSNVNSKRSSRVSTGKDKTREGDSNRKDKSIEGISNGKDKTIEGISNGKDKSIEVISNRNNKSIEGIFNRNDKSIEGISNRNDKSIEVISNGKDETIEEVSSENGKTIEGVSNRKDKTIEGTSNRKDTFSDELVVGKDKSSKGLFSGKYKTRESLSNGKDKFSVRVKDKTSESVSDGKNRSSKTVSSGKDQTKIRVSIGKEQSSKRVSFAKEKTCKKVSIGKYKVNTKKSNEQDKCLESNEKSEGKDFNGLVQDHLSSLRGILRDSHKLPPSTYGESRPQHLEPTITSRGPKVAVDNHGGRRRSKGKSGVVEEHKSPSFAERKNFFSQLHMSTAPDVKKSKDQVYGVGYQVRSSPQKLNRPVMAIARSTDEIKNVELKSSQEISF